jgi:predicted  nucleic acid-binding Zn-ribbon protein
LKKENSFYGKSSAPWQDAVIILPENENIPWTEEHDRMLRNQVSKLKGQRSFIQNTVVNLESPFNLDDASNKLDASPPTKSRSRSRQKNMDIETAILMQELMSLREEMCDLKCRTEHSEKEKNLAHEKLKSLQAALVQMQNQLDASENKPKDRFSYSEAEYNASIERELLEALSRECRLKARLQGLAGSLETATKGTMNSSTKNNNNNNNAVSELKQTNVS